MRGISAGRRHACTGLVLLTIGLLAAGCGGEETDSRNGALVPGNNFTVSVDHPYQLQSGPDPQETDVSVETVGQRFTSNESPTTISSVAVRVSRTATSASGPRDISFSLWSATNGTPGRRITNLGSVTVEEGYEGFLTLVVQSSPVLDASRDYFIVADGAPGSGPVAVQTAVNAPWSNVEPAPEFASFLTSDGAAGSWLPNETGRNMVMTVMVEPAGVVVVDSTTTSVDGPVDPAAVPSSSAPTTSPVTAGEQTTTSTVGDGAAVAPDAATTTVDGVGTGTSDTTAPGGQAGSPPVTDATSTGTDGAGTGATGAVDDTTAVTVDSAPGAVGDGTSASGSDAVSPPVAPETKGSLYSPADDPVTTRDLSVTLAAFAALSAVGAAVALGGGVSSAAGAPSRGRLATLATKKLKVTTTSRSGAGDAGRLWRRRGTERLDSLFTRLPVRVGPYSSVAARVLVDGSWARATTGSASVVPWLAAVTLGALWGLDVGDPLGLPAEWILVLALVVACLDSLAGGLVALVVTVVVAASGSVDGWADVRTILGVWVLFLSPPLIGNVIRPLRRVVHDTDTALRERAFDYVMAPVGIMFAVSALAQSLNGLSGTIVVGDGDVTLVRWTVWASMLVRLALEDVAVHSFPERLRSVQPVRIPAQRKVWGVLGAVTRFSLYLIVSEPFFGLGSATVVSALLLTVPFVVKPWEHSLPGSETLWRWLPRGFLRFAILVFLGGWLGAVLLGDSPTADTVRSMTPWLFLPSAFFGIVEYFARAGTPWPDTRLKRWGGAALWAVVVFVLSGSLNPF